MVGGGGGAGNTPHPHPRPLLFHPRWRERGYFTSARALYHVETLISMILELHVCVLKTKTLFNHAEALGLQNKSRLRFAVDMWAFLWGPT